MLAHNYIYMYVLYTHTDIYVSSAPKIMPPILFCWTMPSDGRWWWYGSRSEPSYQYSITCCSCVTDDSREAV